VDAEYFAPQAAEIAPPEIVFTGSMDWQANQDAVTFFVQDVLPLVQAAVPDAHLTVVGRRPPAPIRAMAEADPDHVAVTGTVEDVRPYMARARVAVAPLRFGSGIKIKVFEAMAMAKPIVVTQVAAEGLPLVDRETAMIADTSQAMADRVIELLTDAEKASEMGRRGRDLVASRHDWSAVAEALGQTCEKALARRRRT
jgi:polysaccharide biosynthesis protein PslH